jgi:Lrp/AsnC family leucine-responsive transcriptional regulator
MMVDSVDANTLDAVDLRLLGLLQDDASRSNQALAEAAHVSPATALRRVRRLVEAGIIERQVAIVAPAKVGGLSVIAEITLDRQGAEHVATFEARAVAEARCSSATASRPGRIWCWCCGCPTWRPTTRWCNACSRRMPMCAT